MDERDLLSRIRDEEEAALGHHTGELASARTEALEYYLQFPLGNEVEGESQVIDSTVRDTIEWMLPSLIRIFAASGRICEFEPVGPEDIDGAEQASDGVNHVFWKWNNGFLILYQWFKDSLISKNGIVKWYYDERNIRRKERYSGLTEEGLAMLLANDNVEVLAHSQIDTQFGPLHDVEIEVIYPDKKVRIENVPPEEFLISARHNSIEIEDCEFCEHRTRKTLSELREMGFDVEEEDLGSGEDSFAEISAEYLARRAYTEEQFPEDERSGPSSPYWLREVYIRFDYDDDGIAELRRVLVVGNKILLNEEADIIQFAALSPNVMPHRFVGLSVADEVMDLQEIKTTLWRETLNNLYLTNRPRKAVLATAGGNVYASLEDLLTSRVGGIVREYKGGAVRELTTPFMAGHTFPMFEYIDQQRMNRTGENFLSSGLDADAINKTARGAVIAENKMAEKKELIARLFAETGVKALMKGILHCLNKHDFSKMMVRLNGKFIAMDPRNWNTQWDVTVNVGLGTGNKDQQLGHLMNLAMVQERMLMAGKSHMVTDENLYSTAKKIAENAGYKNVEEFFSDPKGKPPPQPAPPPEVIKGQMEMQKEQFKAQQEQLKTQADAQLELTKQKIIQDGASQVANIHSTTQLQIEQLRLKHQERIERMKLDAEAEFRLLEARIAADKHADDIAESAEERTARYKNAMEERRKKYEEPEENEDRRTNEVVSAIDSIQKESIRAVEETIRKAVDNLEEEIEDINEKLSSKIESIDKRIKDKPRKLSVKAPSGNTYDVDIE